MIHPGFFLLSLLSCLSLVAAKLIAVPFDSPRIVYDSAGWTFSREDASGTTAVNSSLTDVTDACTDLTRMGAAVSFQPGAGFSFEFAGKPRTTEVYQFHC